jgi:hypothetical protein
VIYSHRLSSSRRGLLEERRWEYITGITNILEDAQVWKKKRNAKQAVVKYLDLLIEQLENTNQVELSIRKLKRLSNGKLKDEPEEDLIFEQTKKPPL